MNEKMFRARIQHKHKTEAEWYLDVYTSAGSTELRENPFVPLGGELIIFDKDATHEFDRFKFGDGETNVMELPFASAEQVQADWEQNDETKADFVKNRTHYTEDDGNVVQLDAKYIPIDNNTITTDVDGKLIANISSGSNYAIEIDSSGSDSGVYLKNTDDGTREKILSLYDIPGGTRSITTGSNTSLGTNIQYSQIFGTGHTIATDSAYNLIAGQGNEVNGGYNIISGRSNKVTNASNYNAVFCGNTGTIRTITGNNNLVAAAGNTTVTGSHDFVVGTGTVTVIGGGNITGGNAGAREITGNSNFVLVSGSTVKILKGAADSIANVVVGKGHTVTGSYNITNGGPNTITGDYNFALSSESSIAGNNNVIASSGKITITGSNSLVVGAGAATIVGGGNITGGNAGTRNITGNSNFVLTSGGTITIDKNGNADSIANTIIGRGHTVKGSYNIDNGGANNITGNYNIVNGVDSPVTGSYNMVISNASEITGNNNLIKTDSLKVEGNYNLAAATVEFNTEGFESKIIGHANFISGDFSDSEITGNYNSIFGGGGNNSITGTSSDPAQHNFVCGSNNTLTNSENCLTFGKNHTISNFNRAALFGQGLTATRNNQVIVGSYNNDQKGPFIVANGSSTVPSSDPVSNVSVDSPVNVSSFDTAKQYYASNGSTIVRIFNTGNGWTTNSNLLKVVDSQFVSTDGDWDIYETNKFNALTVYAGGTVEVGHNPVGPMDVVTKHYLEYALLNGEW